MGDKERRLDDLEKQTGAGESLVVVDWGGPTVTVKGEVLTRAEYEKRYPNPKVVTWDDDIKYINVGLKDDESEIKT
jgi:hypothetical protein